MCVHDLKLFSLSLFLNLGVVSPLSYQTVTEFMNLSEDFFTLFWIFLL